MIRIFLPLLIVACLKAQAQTITTVAGGNGYGTAANQFEYPYGLWLDRSGNIYVSDQNNSRVQMFPAGSSSSTNGITIAGGNGQSSPGQLVLANQFNYPAGICVDSIGDLYVADYGDNRIQFFPAGSTSLTNGATLAGGNGPGALSLQLDFPLAVFLDKYGNLYIADADNDRIQMFPQGSTSGTGGITVAGGYGQGDSAYQLNYPAGIFVDTGGNVYVADNLNNRVQRFSPPDTIGVTIAGGNGMGNAANQLNAPTDVFLDKNGNLYVADFYNNRIQMFPPGSTSSTDGVTVAGGNGPGSDPHQLDNPSSIYVDSAGNIYVADYLNNRIQKWSPMAAGLAAIAPQNKMLIYPNPNTGSFILSSSESIGKEYVIYDMIGRAVAQQAITSDRQTITLKDLSAGSYTLEIIGKKAIRFVLEN